MKSYQNYQLISLELGEDAIVQSHLAALYDNLLEKNLLHLVLSPHDIEIKLSQMILDKILNAIIDHNSGCLMIYEEEKGKVDANFGLIQGCFKNMDNVLESLVLKSKSI